MKTLCHKPHLKDDLNRFQMTPLSKCGLYLMAGLIYALKIMPNIILLVLGSSSTYFIITVVRLVNTFRGHQGEITVRFI